MHMCYIKLNMTAVQICPAGLRLAESLTVHPIDCIAFLIAAFSL
jgi:hypothetical protein